MSPDALRPVFAWVVVGLLVAETLWSHRNERRLRAQGAREPDGDVYGLLRMAYPAGFVCAIAEGMLAGVPGAAAAGMLVFALAKALKYWAMASLGERWCFRVLVPPGSRPLLTGPYRWLRHPNYVAVALELASVALVFGAWRSGPVAVAGFVWLMRRRIRVEERALGYDAHDA